MILSATAPEVGESVAETELLAVGVGPEEEEDGVGVGTPVTLLLLKQ